MRIIIVKSLGAVTFIMFVLLDILHFIVTFVLLHLILSYNSVHSVIQLISDIVTRYMHVPVNTRLYKTGESLENEMDFKLKSRSSICFHAFHLVS